MEVGLEMYGGMVGWFLRMDRELNDKEVNDKLRTIDALPSE